MYCINGHIAELTLQFGGKGPAFFTCIKCGQRYDMDGEPITNGKPQR